MSDVHSDAPARADWDEQVLLKTLDEVVTSGEFILRSRSAELELKLAALCPGTTVRLTASPGSALLLVLTALGYGSGDEVAVGVPSPTVAGAMARLSSTARCFELQRAIVSDLRCGHPLAVDGHGVVLIDHLPTAKTWGKLNATTAIIDLGPNTQAGGVAAAAAVFTTDADVAERVRMLRNHGQDGITRFLHHVIGFNSRMDEIAAGYLLAALPLEAL